MIHFHHIDCMNFMRDLPNKAYDIGFVDPNYGIGESSKDYNSRNTGIPQKNGKISYASDKNYKRGDWDKERPAEEYFKELFRVTKKQIIWGGNYFTDLLPEFSSGRIIWDKVNGASDFSDCEIAWTNLFTSTRQIRYMWNGMMQGKSIKEGHIQQGNKKLNESRIHQCQKPVKLYEELIKRYISKGSKILETHGGSGSIAIACDKLDYELDICEIDQDHYANSLHRYHVYKQQIRMII